MFGTFKGGFKRISGRYIDTTWAVLGVEQTSNKVRVAHHTFRVPLQLQQIMFTINQSNLVDIMVLYYIQIDIYIFIDMYIIYIYTHIMCRLHAYHTHTAYIYIYIFIRIYFIYIYVLHMHILHAYKHFYTYYIRPFSIYTSYLHIVYLYYVHIISSMYRNRWKMTKMRWMGAPSWSKRCLKNT